MVSDVGGMSELVDLERFSEAVVPGGDYADLAVALQTVLERGTLPVLPLRQEVGSYTGSTSSDLTRGSTGAAETLFTQCSQLQLQLQQGR